MTNVAGATPLVLKAYDSYRDFCERLTITPMPIEQWSKVAGSGLCIASSGVELRSKRPAAESGREP